MSLAWLHMPAQRCAVKAECLWEKRAQLVTFITEPGVSLPAVMDFKQQIHSEWWGYQTPWVSLPVVHLPIFLLLSRPPLRWP